MRQRNPREKPRQTASRPSFVFEELEPRLLLSADLPVDVPVAYPSDDPADEELFQDINALLTETAAQQTASRELVFVDTDTPDYQLILDDLLNSGEKREFEVVLLDNDSDGIAQISESLSQYTELDAVHVISHGSEGAVDLGGSRLEFDSLLANANTIQGWSNAFSEQGDLLIYGCNLATSDTGQALVDSLARLTGADVAASDDFTGSNDMGGDWDLEYQTGRIETSVAVSAELRRDWTETLAAPEIDNSGAMRLTDIAENAINPPGDTVADIIASAGGDRITDVDPGAVEGIAVTGVDDTNGTWQFNVGAGSWTAFGAVSDTAAVLLDDAALVRFIPNAGYSGSAGGLSFRAWDTTDGNPSGSTGVDVSANGGMTAYSTYLETATLTVVADSGKTLWISTEQDVPAPSGWNGVASEAVAASEILSLGGPNLAFESGTGTTDGTFSRMVDFDPMVVAGVSRIDALHVVGSDISVGTNAISLSKGDMLFSMFQGSTTTLQNSDLTTLDVDRNDIVLFRPDVPGNYNAGTYSILVDGSDLGINSLSSFTLVEQSTIVGQGGGVTTLDAGDILFVDWNAAAADAHILRLQPGTLGDTTTGTVSILVDGNDLSSDFSLPVIVGLDLVEQDTAIGGSLLRAGQILLSLPSTDDIGGVSTSEHDIVVLDVTTTGTNSVATASLFFDGSKVGLDAWQEDIRGLSVSASNNYAPVITSNGGGASANINVSENTTAVATVTATDADLDTVTYSISGGADAGLFSIDANSGVLTFGSAPNFEAPADANADNVYDVTVRASDGKGGTDTQAISVTVAEVLELAVTSTNATGTGSLHEAILNANANTGVTDTITFNIPGGGPHVINLTSALPAITDTVIIDGTTEPDYAGTPMIVLDGSSAGSSSGLTLNADNSTIRGLVINGFTQNGIVINGNGNTIVGNWIGVDPTGLLDSGNGLDGIQINGDNNIIGGAVPADRNVISGNSDEGIDINAGATGTIIQGNYVGTNASGTAAIPNGAGGVGNWGGILVGGHNTTVGGTNSGEGNLISGNHSWGIIVESNNSIVQGNLIGTAADGTTALGNTGHGLVAHDYGGGLNNLIGGTVPGAGNVIANNGLDGIAATGNVSATFLGNIILNNTGMGIDLGDDGMSANDAGDIDSGSNALQNFPVITSAELSGTDLTLGGSLDTDGLNTQYRIEFYGNAAGTQDATNGEGRIYLGSATVTTDGSGDAVYSNVTLGSVSLSVGDYVTATATVIVNPAQVGVDDQLAYGSTSEFAANVAITLPNTAPVINSDGGGVTAAINVTENTTAVTTVTATDADLDALTYSISGGADAALFSIDANTGVLTFKGAPDYETPSDSGADNIYEVIVQVDDRSGGIDAQTINVTITNVDPVAVNDAYAVNADSTLDSDWWDTDWTRRQGITFDNLAQAETLTDFPVLLVLNSSNIDYAQTNDDGSDLRFFAADGTELAYEIEQWDEAGNSSVWVRVPQITGNSASDSIWMYYGNATAESGAQPGTVWDSNFVGIWHLNEEQAGAGSDGVYADSTSFGNDGIDRVVSTGQEGQVTDGQQFGANDWVEIDHDSSLDLKDSMTISFWIKPTSDSGTFNRVVEKGLWGYNNSYYFGGGNGTNDLTFYLNGQEVIDTADNVLTVGEWQQATVSYTSNGDGTGTARIYLNGVEIASGNYTNGFVPGNTGRLAIGHNDPLYDFDGFVDEVQISNTDRSADWIAAQYQATKNQFGAEFVQFGGEESVPAVGGVMTNDLPDGMPGISVSNLDTTGTLGLVTLNSDGTFSYDPNGQFDYLVGGATAIDTFTYDVTEANGAMTTATVTITITGVNNVPVANADSFTVSEGSTTNLNLVVNDNDADDGLDLTSIAIVGGPSNGSIVVNTDGTVDYTHDGSETLVDSFTYTIDDLAGATSNTVTVSLTITPVNDAPTGAVTISGTPTEDQVLMAGNTLADEDGLGAISYQWQRNGVDIGGATSSTYTLTQADVGTTITVVASYIDGQGTNESITSAGVGPIANSNNAPTGSVTISGTPTEDQTLTASNTLADTDGMGVVSYQWQRDGLDIAGATGSTYVLGDADVGSTITVVASYTDGLGANESMSSAGVGPVANVNDAPIARPDGVYGSFDGDDFIQVANHASLQMTNNVTMEAWINHDGTGTGSQIIVNKEGEYELGITSDTGEIKWAIANTLPAWTWHNTGYFVTAGEWTHVAVTYDGVAGEARTYINGELVDNFAQSGAIGDVYTTYNDLFIGGRENAVTQRFQGQIDEVRVWSSTRTQVEIQANMDGLLTGGEPDLAGNWRLDEAFGGAVIDQSLFGNNGTLGGLEGAAATPTYQGYFTSEDSVLTVPAVSGVLANDFDIEGDTLTVTNLDTTGMLGSLVLNPADGSFTYDPRGVFDSLGDGEHVTETFTYTANDGSSDSNTVAVTITVTGANDAPTVSTVVMSGNEDTAIAFAAADFNAAFSDVDADSLTQIQVTSLPANGTLQLSGVAVNVNDTIAVGQLGNLSFTPNTHWNGSTSFTWLGHDGTTWTAASSTVNLTVNPVNDAPISGMPSGQTTSVNTPLEFSNLDGNGISVADPDGMGATLEVTLTASNGVLSLSNTAGLVFSTGSGTNDATMTFTGDVATINAALDGLSFQPDADFEGFATLQLVTDDMGNSGSGGALNAVDSIGISVVANASIPANLPPPLDELIVDYPDLPAIDPDPVPQAPTVAQTPTLQQQSNSTTESGYVDFYGSSGLVSESNSKPLRSSGDVSVFETIVPADNNGQPDQTDERAITKRLWNAIADPLVSVQTLSTLPPGSLIWNFIDLMTDQITTDGSGTTDSNIYVIGTTATGVTFAFSAGYVSWLLRAGYLSAALLSSAPVWRQFDPLPILSESDETQPTSGKKNQDSARADDRRVENIFKPDARSGPNEAV